MDDEDITVYEFHKNSEEKVVTMFRRYRGHDLIDLRIFYQTDDGDWRPTRKGLCLAADLLPELEEAVRMLREAVERQEREG